MRLVKNEQKTPVTAVTSITIFCSAADGLVSNEALIVCGCGGEIHVFSSISTHGSTSDGSDVHNSEQYNQMEIFDSHSVHGVNLFILSIEGKSVTFACVFGQKGISILEIPTQSSKESIHTHSTSSAAASSASSSSQLSSQEAHDMRISIPSLDDLVLDAIFVPITYLKSKNPKSIDGLLIVGYAHNFVDIIAISPTDVQRRVRVICPKTCVLFSMKLHLLAKSETCFHVVIASGTAYGDIILWEIQVPLEGFTSTHSKMSILGILRGHEGVITRVTLNPVNVIPHCSMAASYAA